MLTKLINFFMGAIQSAERRIAYRGLRIKAPIIVTPFLWYSQCVMDPDRLLISISFWQMALARFNRNFLIATLVHEYGHAFETKVWGALSRTDRRKWRKLFGVPRKERLAATYNPHKFVSGYATTDSFENFAETFENYVMKGKKSYTGLVLQKMEFIEKIISTYQI